MGDPSAVLQDGSYDAVVVDAEREGDDVVLELTVLTGVHRGELVAVRAHDVDGDPLYLLGLPATLTVVGGRPAVRLDG